MKQKIKLRPMSEKPILHRIVYAQCICENLDCYRVDDDWDYLRIREGLRGWIYANDLDFEIEEANERI